MLLLLFGNAGSGTPTVTPTGHPGFSRARQTGNFLANDDAQAVQMLLDAESEAILEALDRFENVLRRLL